MKKTHLSSKSFDIPLSRDFERPLSRFLFNPGARWQKLPSAILFYFRARMLEEGGVPYWGPWTVRKKLHAKERF
jgi:hypothetical protein